MRKDDFRQWAVLTVDKESTINGYISSLENDIPEKLHSDGNGLELNTIFECTIDDVDFLNELYNKCSIGSDWYTWNRSKGGGRPMAALGKYIQFLTGKQVKSLEITQQAIGTPKNIILYGPPGVGKTYSHKKLISILEKGDSLEELENSDYKTDSFDVVTAEGRYQFLTFHQSYSYEDFVEGFRPNEEGKIERSNGLFKDISNKAKKSLIDSLKPIQTLEQEKTFDQLFQEFIDYV